MNDHPTSRITGSLHTPVWIGCGEHTIQTIIGDVKVNFISRDDIRDPVTNIINGAINLTKGITRCDKRPLVIVIIGYGVSYGVRRIGYLTDNIIGVAYGVVVRESRAY